MSSNSQWNSVAFGNGVFVAVSMSIGTIAATSTDGLTWTARTLPSSSYWSGVTFGNNSFLAVSGGTSGNSTAAATSTDGVTWTSRVLPTNSPWYSVTFGNSLFVPVVYGGTAAASIAYAVNATSFVLPKVQPLTGTTPYVKAT
tara:strand:- start:1042 stop:1470 length:429 start_codon:yes stop_codon:yes gene_type:complete